MSKTTKTRPSQGGKMADPVGNYTNDLSRMEAWNASVLEAINVLADHIGVRDAVEGCSLDEIGSIACAEVAKLRAREKSREMWTGITNAEPAVLTRELLEETARKMQMAPDHEREPGRIFVMRDPESDHAACRQHLKLADSTQTELHRQMREATEAADAWKSKCLEMRVAILDLRNQALDVESSPGVHPLVGRNASATADRLLEIHATASPGNDVAPDNDVAPGAPGVCYHVWLDGRSREKQNCRTCGKSWQQVQAENADGWPANFPMAELARMKVDNTRHGYGRFFARRFIVDGDSFDVRLHRLTGEISHKKGGQQWQNG